MVYVYHNVAAVAALTSILIGGVGLLAPGAFVSVVFQPRYAIASHDPFAQWLLMVSCLLICGWGGIGFTTGALLRGQRGIFMAGSAALALTSVALFAGYRSGIVSHVSALFALGDLWLAAVMAKSWFYPQYY